MMDLFLDFIQFRDPNVRFVLAGTVLLGISSGVLGCFTLLRRRALVGDAVAHAILPGVCLAFIVAGGKDPVWLIAGALFFGILSIFVMDFISGNSRIAPDASMAMVLSVFFGLGVVLLTFIQSSVYTDQSGLDDFLFGQAATMVGYDVWVFGGLSLLILLAVLYAFKELQLISFDPSFAKGIGYPVRRMEWLLAVLLILTITAGIQAVGVVLMASMLIIPAAAARYWTDSLKVMMALAALAGAFSGFTGTFISYTAPSMPTGPWMVVSASFLFFISFLMAPGRGEWARWRQKKKMSRKIASENVLKALYAMEEHDGKPYRIHTKEALQGWRPMPEEIMNRALSNLTRGRQITVSADRPQEIRLTEAGRREAERLVRVHRLWEQYLNEYLLIAEDHVHDGAESMEHLITTDLEERLKSTLGSPDKDPHKSVIPYEKTEKRENSQ